MVWISSNTIFLTTTWFLRFHKGKLDLWGCFMLICWPKQRATVILLRLMTFLSFALLKYDQNIWILYAWLIPVCYGKQKGKEKKAIRFRLNCPHLNLFSLSPFFSSHVLFTGIFSILIRALGSNLRGECTKLCELN